MQVGDLVEVVSIHEGDEEFFTVGNRGVIERITPEDYYVDFQADERCIDHVKCSGGAWYVQPDSVELVK